MLSDHERTGVTVYLRFVLRELDSMPPHVRAETLWWLRRAVDAQEPTTHQTMPIDQHRQSRFYARVRMRVQLRDGFRCVKCGSTRELECNHLAYRGILGTAAEADYCETTCRSCHLQFHGRADDSGPSVDLAVTAATQRHQVGPVQTSGGQWPEAV